MATITHALAEYEARVIQEITDSHDARAKALEAQAFSLTVSADQLTAAAKSCTGSMTGTAPYFPHVDRDAVVLVWRRKSFTSEREDFWASVDLPLGIVFVRAEETPLHVVRAFEFASKALALTAVKALPCEGPDLSVRIHTEAVLFALTHSTQVMTDTKQWVADLLRMDGPVAIHALDLAGVFVRHLRVVTIVCKMVRNSPHCGVGCGAVRWSDSVGEPGVGRTHPMAAGEDQVRGEDAFVSIPSHASHFRSPRFCFTQIAWVSALVNSLLECFDAVSARDL